MKSFYDEIPQGNIVAIFGDGSGAALFGFYDGTFYEADGGEHVDADYFIDAGYVWWLPLPDDFVFWCDKEQ